MAAVIALTGMHNWGVQYIILCQYKQSNYSSKRVALGLSRCITWRRLPNGQDVITKRYAAGGNGL